MWRMSNLNPLRSGMTLEEVRRSLTGWRKGKENTAILSPDKTHLFFTVDFTPPPGASEPTIRMTFDNGRLIFWGEPAKHDEPGGRSCAAG
jgi:hypothetical protein